MKIEHISVSRNECYKECEAKYKYKYHLQLPRDEGIDEPAYFVYGKIIHKISETYIARKGKDTLNKIAKEVLSGKLEIEKGVKAPKLSADYQRKLPDHLRSLQKLNDKIGIDGICEHHFLYDLDPPNEKFIKGFIDRIIQRGKKFFVIDYKTTQKGPYRKNKATITRDIQLRTYANVIRRDFGAKAEDITVALYYVDGGDLFPAVFTEKSLLDVEKELLDAYNRIAIKNPDEIIPNVGKHCKRCDYRFSCPFIRSQ